MPSKFAKYKDVLEPWKPEPNYQERVEEIKRNYIGIDINKLTISMEVWNKQKDQLDAALANCNLKIEALSQLIVAELESQDAQSIELESGLKVRLDIKPYVSVLPTPEAAKQYEKWVNSAGIRKMKTLNAQRRDAIIKEDYLKEGLPLPKWCKVFLKTRAKITGGNGG